jgi:hypothetical protein
MQELVPNSQQNNLTVPDTTKFEEYLTFLGLPTDNVIAPSIERVRIIQNQTDFIASLNNEIKKEARYLSKFAAATAIGLFDAALNYVWNEVVLALRHTVVIYGLDLFFDAAVGGSQREDFKKEEDLSGLKDNTLVNTCRKLELISDTTHKKLLHMLTMRNDIGASHANDYAINAFELLGWLQTCITDILNAKPSEAAIQIQAFISEIKKNSEILEDGHIQSIKIVLKDLSLQNTNNLLNTLFSIYTDEDSNATVRKNISLIAPHIWNNSSGDVKLQLGIRLDGYKNNLHNYKYQLGNEFFDFCDGNEYKSLDSRIIEINESTDNLLNARYGWDNFHNEPQHIRKLLSYIKQEKDIPKDCIQKIVKVVLICRIGKGISYNSGVSPMGKPLYDKFFSLLGDDSVPYLLVAMHSHEVANILENDRCRNHMLEVINNVEKNVVSERLKEIIGYLKDNPNILHKIHNDTRYKELTKSCIYWK